MHRQWRVDGFDGARQQRRDGAATVRLATVMSELGRSQQQTFADEK